MNHCHFLCHHLIISKSCILPVHVIQLFISHPQRRIWKHGSHCIHSTPARNNYGRTKAYTFRRVWLGHSAMQIVRLKKANLGTLDQVLAQASTLRPSGLEPALEQLHRLARKLLLSSWEQFRRHPRTRAHAAASGLVERVKKLDSVTSDLTSATAQLQKTLSALSLRTAGAPPPPQRFPPSTGQPGDKGPASPAARRDTSWPTALTL